MCIICGQCDVSWTNKQHGSVPSWNSELPRQAQGAVDNGGQYIMREQGRWQQ